MQVKLLKFNIFKDDSGSLLPISFKKELPIRIKRVFIIFGKRKFVRSKHAHIKSKQIYVPLNGKIKVLVNKEKEFELDIKKKQGLLIPEKTWTELYFEKDGDSLLVLTDTEYYKNDYIRNYNKFKKLRK